jgi:hypothetical protein
MFVLKKRCNMRYLMTFVSVFMAQDLDKSFVAITDT